MKDGMILLSDLMAGWNYERHPCWSRTFLRAAKRKWRKSVSTRCRCGEEMIFGALNGRDKRAATIDHVLARGLGGADHPTNMTVICAECNRRKADIESRQVTALRVPLHIRLGWSADATRAAYEAEAA